MTVLFNSARPLSRCENIAAVWRKYDGPKRFFQGGWTDVSNFNDCHVVVTDEFVRKTNPYQTVVMIAHGLTGGKLYGRDQRNGQFTRDSDSCNLVDFYVTSSEYGRKFAASAAGIGIEKCVPLGMPRTDAYIGRRKGDGMTFLADYDRAYLYVPTFRSSYNKPRTPIDWAAVDAELSDGEVLVVKRHVIVTSSFLGDRYEHIVEVEPSEPSTPYLIDCDVVATDFSSILFDGYALGKPSVLTVEDMDDYLNVRGMYMDYPSEYGSRHVDATDARAFVRGLRDAAENGMTDAELLCRERTSGACDGHSTERVIELVRSLT